MLPPCTPSGVAPPPHFERSAYLPAPRERAPARPGAAGLVDTQQSGRGTLLTLENTGIHRAQRAKRRTITSARLLQQDLQRGGRKGRWLMVTLTYRETVEWHRSHLRGLTDCYRHWAKRHGARVAYLWVMELTKRSRPHYHLLVWVPSRLMLPKPDKKGWWPHGMTRTEVARNAVGYLAKYASKLFDVQSQSIGDINPDGSATWRRFPKHARICGGGGLGEARAALRYWMTPRWFRERVPDITDVRRVVGGFVIRATGELVLSPWIFVGFSACRRWIVFAPRELEPCGA
jgi:hypothetical protein